MKKLITFLFLIFSVNAYSDLKKDLDNQLEPLMKKVIEWRHDIHQYPELSNREFRTSKKVAEHLTCLLYTSPSPRDGLLSRMPSSA